IRQHALQRGFDAGVEASALRPLALIELHERLHVRRHRRTTIGVARKREEDATNVTPTWCSPAFTGMRGVDRPLPVVFAISSSQSNSFTRSPSIVTSSCSPLTPLSTAWK